MGIRQRKEKAIEMKRNDIIDAAERVFFHKGFQNATMDDVAKEAEFTKKTLYVYFSSKEDLYHEIMLRGFKILNEMNDKALSDNPKAGEIEKILLLGRNYIYFSMHYPGYYQAIIDYENKDLNFSKESDNPKLKAVYQTGQHSIELLQYCILNGIEKGEIKKDLDPITLIMLFWSLSIGFTGLIGKKKKYVQAYYQKDPRDLFEEALNIILRAISYE